MSNNKTNDWKDREIGALWKKQTAAGNTVLSGKVGDQPVIIMVNKFKKESNNPNAPDYRVYKIEPRSEGQSPSQAKPKPKTNRAPAPKPEPEDQPVDDIAF